MRKKVDAQTQCDQVAMENMRSVIVDVETPMPPTLNKSYINTNKGRRLTTHAKKTKETITKVVALYLLKNDINTSKLKNSKLFLRVDFYFKNVENKGWPKKAKNRYKKNDISNRLKLLEDAVSDAVGIDDSNTFEITLTKNQHRQEKCHVQLEVEIE